MTTQTQINENEFGHEFTLETAYGDNLQIRETFNDGSSDTFIFDPDHEYRVVRFEDGRVMLERIFNDGSTRTKNVPAMWFESIFPALERYF